MKILHLIKLVLVAAMVLAPACGPKPVPPVSPLDTPQSAYERGQLALADGDIAQAQAAFDRARQLDPDYAPAYEGLGLVLLTQGDTKEAIKQFGRSKSRDGAYAPAWTGMGRAYDVEGRYKKALDEFLQALKRDKGGQWAHVTQFYTGQTYEHMEEYLSAQEAYRAALSIKPSYIMADEAWKRLNERERTMAGMPSEYVAIIQSSEITRAELAALLANELPLERIFRKTPEYREPVFQPPDASSAATNQEMQISDVRNSWAGSYIERVVEMGAMEIYPDGRFKPDEQVTRAELAQVAQNVLTAALNDSKLSTLYVGNASTFTDVPRTHFAFNAITLVINRGIMAPRTDGTFGLMDPVTGTEAVRVVHILRQSTE